MVPHSLLLLSLLAQVLASPAASSYDHEETALQDLGISKLRRRHLEKRGVRVAFNRAVPFAPATPDLPTENTLDLEAVPGVPLSHRFLDALLDGEEIVAPEPAAPAAPAAAQSEEIQNIRDSVYLTAMTFGNEHFKLVIDTGSADTWLVGSGFRCISMLTKQPTSAASCRFAKSYNQTSTFKRVGNQHFNISYADGEFLNGPMGRETVKFGGITVPDQEFGLINLAAWNGDSVSSGLTGLAYPSVTRAYPGTDPKSDRRGGNVPYDPIFTSMWKKKLVAPHFSVALNRAGESAGTIALGGLPPQGGQMKYETTFAKAPMQHLSIQRPGAKASADYQLYVVQTDGWDIFAPNGQKASEVANTKSKVVLDTGTTLSYLPSAITAAINSRFDPPAKLNPLTRQWVVKCNAKAPKVAMRIGGKDVRFDGRDIVMNLGRPNSGGDCMAGIQENRSPLSPNILGGVFLKNVVAVFDIGAGEMRFANRIR